MLNYENYLCWKKEIKNNLVMIATNYNPEKKKHYLIKRFDLECPISDIQKNAQIIFECCKMYLGVKYNLQFEDNTTTWNEPILIRKRSKILLFLKSIGADKYKSPRKIRIRNENKLFEFLNTFIDVPMLNQSSNILLFGIDSDCIIVISNHGTIWLLMDGKEKIADIAKYLDSKGITVLFGK